MKNLLIIESSKVVKIEFDPIYTNGIASTKKVSTKDTTKCTMQIANNISSCYSFSIGNNSPNSRQASIHFSPIKK